LNNLRLLQILISVMGISIGQVFLKLAAQHMQQPGHGESSLLLFLFNGYLVVGVAVLGCSTLLWTWILRSTPLSSAYPFMALAFVFVPAICYLFLGETVGARQIAGAALIVAGVVAISL
jgi:drug/metabolite transporter (DMT)-like permease